MHILPFRIEEVWLAIDAGQVEQILGKREWTKVPAALAQWPGVLAWRGRAVAVLDLASLLEHPPLLSNRSRSRTLIAKACGSLLAIPVDEIREAQLVAEALLRPVHVTRQRYAAYELELGASVVPIIDAVALVTDGLAQAAESNRGVGPRVAPAS